MMNCSDTRRRVDPYLDGELGMEDNVEVVRHLEACVACSSVFEGEKRFFDGLRREAEKVQASENLRGRIAAGLKPAPARIKPWPFSRALVPAAAAAILLAVFVSFFASQPVGAQTIARRAAAWHNGGAARSVLLSSAPEIEKYYSEKGIKSCTHERTVKNSMNYDYKYACVEESGPAGGDTSWWVAMCPKTGCKVSHACFAAPPGLEKTWPERERRVVRLPGRTVVMNHRRGEICLLVFDNYREAERYQAASAP